MAGRDSCAKSTAHTNKYAMRAIELTEAPVGNFNENLPREVDGSFVRGGRPLNRAAIAELKDQGIQTVICLLRSDKSYDAEISGVQAEKQAVEAAGMRFVAIDMDERRNPKESDIQAFLGAVKSGGRSYAHCSAGRDRVGLMNAIYDYKVRGFSYEQAYEKYLEGGHDFLSWTNLDKFFYDYAGGTPETAQQAITSALGSSRYNAWLYHQLVD